MSRNRPMLPEELVAQRLARVRGDSLRRWWRRNRALVAVATALAAIVLGLWGYSVSPATPRGDLGGWAERAFDTVALFRFGGPDDDLNWQLQLARVLAPLVVGYAFLGALIRLFRDQAQLLRLRLFARRHVVVAGLGQRGFMLVNALHETGVRVVAVEVDAENRSLAGCRERGIPVIVGDARDPEVLAQARCDRALHVVCCCAEDALNVDVLATCAALAERPGWLPTVAHVLLESTALRLRLQTLNLASPHRPALRVDFASVSALAGRALVGASGDVWRPARDRPSVIVAVAATPTGRQSALAALRLAAGTGHAPRLTLIGVDAEQDRSALMCEAPWLSPIACSVTWNPATPGAVPAGVPPDADVALVCHPDDATGLAQAIGLSERLACPVVVDVGDDRVARSLVAVGLKLRAVTPVGGAQRVLGPALLLDTATEAIARARHDAYIRFEAAAGRTGTRNPSLVSWDELPESLKESNRRFADGVGEKLAALGGRLVEHGPVGSAAQPPVLTRDAVEQLARAEHDRWARDLIEDGWRRTEAGKDESARLHPLLVSWDELREEEREKDRDSIRELPRLLEAAGYTIVFDGSSVIPNGSGELAEVGASA
jgi:hypothetical protein